MDGSDKIYTGDGNDTVLGGNGQDSLYGESGDDLLIGGSGKDTIDGGDGGDGGDGADTIQGDASNDKLTGGAGADYINGGAGFDLFVFEARMRHDTVTDFENDIDMFDFTPLGITSISELTIYQQGADTVIQVNAGNDVTVLNTLVGDIDASDFYFG